MKLNKTLISELVFWYRNGDAYVGERVALGKYEEYETKLLLRQLNNNSIAVDVGANIGYYTVQMAKICKRVYAIEPDKDNFEILKKNVEENKLNNVVLINAAVGAKKEKITLYKSAANDGDHRVYNAGNRTNIAEVFSVRLDDILVNEQKIDLLKVDTQGWEPAVIEGGKEIIKRDTPNMFLEYWPSAYKEAKLDANRMMIFLESIYKNIWQIDSRLNIYNKEIKIDEETGYADLWLTSKDYMVWDQYKDLKIKKIIKKIFKVK